MKLLDKELLEKCRICPRKCGVNRLEGNRGFCGEAAELMVARAALHMWEEPCISGDKGSGAVFFSGCPLGCVFCQNRHISSGKSGKLITTERLAEIFFELEEKGANNINLVTPDHYVPQIVEAIDMAKREGLELPFVYNCSGYETVEVVKRLDGYIDIYLPDFKYMSPVLSEKYSHASDYAQVAKAAVSEMVRQAGGEKTAFYDNGIMKRGVIVRHLQLPGCMEDSKQVIAYLYHTYGNDIYISIMNQYTPMKKIEEKYPELGVRLSNEEYDELVDYAISLGVENGFIQEGETASESFIPEFNNEGV